MPLMATQHQHQTYEDLIPENAPDTVVPKGVKTATVKIRRDYWPVCKLTGGQTRLYAGQVVKLPVPEAKRVVELNIGTLAFEEDDEAA